MTLIELILVMVIICVVLAMAAPSLGGFFGSRRTADAAAQALALARYARSQAATEGRAYRLNLGLDDGEYWLTREEAGGFARLKTEFGRTFTLPDGTVAAWRKQPGDPLRAYIEFLPDGRTDPAALRLTGRRGETFDIVCRTPAERFRILTPKEVEQ